MKKHTDDSINLDLVVAHDRLLIDFALPQTVFIFTGRPDLERVILQIIAGIELGTGLPEAVVAKAEKQKDEMRKLASELVFEQTSSFDKFCALLKRCMHAYSEQELRTIIAASTKKKDSGLMEAELDIYMVLDELMPDAFTESEVSSIS